MKRFLLIFCFVAGCASEPTQEVPAAVPVQLFSASSNAERLPADMVASVLSGSTVYGKYAEGNAEFIEFHYPNGKAELRNVFKDFNNGIVDATGTWRIRGNAICYDYSTAERYDGMGPQFIALPENCSSVFISSGGIEFLTLDRTGLSVVQRIENPDFEYDFASGFAFNDDDIEAATSSTGTGFFVSEDGTVLTNKHVVESCSSIEVVANGVSAKASLVDVSATSDLAILSAEANGIQPIVFRSTPPRLGEDITVAGYPLVGILNEGLKVTAGELNSAMDRAGVVQLSAEIQPGNSGSPVFDRSGLVVGIVFSKLDDGFYQREVGGVAQNVNFAVSGPTAVEFMRKSGVYPALVEASDEIRREVLAESAAQSVVLIRCDGNGG